ncbi:MAG: hypothetical protein R2710_02840 [Acidimicrobiales bacterium]
MGSGGGTARALIRSPRFLVLDDATSAVDARIEQQILAVCVGSNEDTTTFIVAQRVSTIELADRVFYLATARSKPAEPMRICSIIRRLRRW